MPAVPPEPSSGDGGGIEVALSQLLHFSLDGADGTNRNRAAGAVCQIQADNDLEAIEAWLKAKRRRSPNTLRSYRREAYRLLAWAIAFKQKPLSSLTVEDIADYHAWLFAPAPHPDWIHRGWEIIRGKPVKDADGQALKDQEDNPILDYRFEESSVRLFMATLAGMFDWLVKAGYLAGNPILLYDGNASARERAEEHANEGDHAISKDIWDWVTATVDTYQPTDISSDEARQFERIRFTLLFLYWTGLRRSEAAEATMDRITRHHGTWVIRVKGKGRKKLEPVILLPPALDALMRYRAARGLPALPSAAETNVPLIEAHRGRKSVTGNYLNTLLKRLFSRLADDAAELDARAAAKLRKATAHWLRHTLTTHNAEAGVPMQDTADQLRHRSMDTTRKVYTHVKRLAKRVEGLELLLDYTNSQNK